MKNLARLLRDESGVTGSLLPRPGSRWWPRCRRSRPAWPRCSARLQAASPRN